LQFIRVIAPIESATVIEVEDDVVAQEQVPLNFVAFESWNKRRTVPVIGRGAAPSGVNKLAMWGVAIRSAVELTAINKPRIVANTNLPTNARIRHTSTLLYPGPFRYRPKLRVERNYIVSDWLRI
jgi:hypothetical protein